MFSTDVCRMHQNILMKLDYSYSLPGPYDTDDFFKVMFCGQGHI